MTLDLKDSTSSLRLPAALRKRAEQRAAARGLSVNELVEVALRKELGLSPDPLYKLLDGVAEHVLAEYPDKDGFPQHVTGDTFRRIPEDPRMGPLYEEAIRGADGNISRELRDKVHRRIGKTIKAVLDAVVVGRSAELGGGELIKTHALLVPRRKTA